MRLNRKLTQAKLSKAVEISTFTLIRWERGERLPDGKRLQKLSETLSYAIVLNTDGLWSCYPRDDLLTVKDGKSLSSVESVDELYRRVSEAKDKSVWQVFFSRLVRDNAQLGTCLRETNGGEDIDEKTFKVMSEVILAMVKPEK